MELELEKPIAEALDSRQMAEAWATYVIERWEQALTTYGVGRSFDLSRSFEKELQLSGGDVQAVIFKFLKYGRFVDMGVGRGWTLNGRVLNRKFDRYRGVDGKLVGDKPRQKKPWYSKTLYSQVARLKELYQAEYGESFIKLNESMIGTVTLNF